MWTTRGAGLWMRLGVSHPNWHTITNHCYCMVWKTPNAHNKQDTINPGALRSQSSHRSLVRVCHCCWTYYLQFDRVTLLRNGGFEFFFFSPMASYQSHNAAAAFSTSESPFRPGGKSATPFGLYAQVCPADWHCYSRQTDKHKRQADTPFISPDCQRKRSIKLKRDSPKGTH